MKSTLLPQLEEIQLDLEASLSELGPEITSNRQYLQGLFWRLICTASAGSETLAEIVKNIHSLGASQIPGPEPDSPPRSPPRRSFGSESLFHKPNMENSKSVRASLSVSIQEAEQVNSVRQLKEELQTCYEDLQKDEEIFQEKMRELKKCRKVIKHLEAEKKLLYAENQAQHQQLQKALYDSRTDHLFSNNNQRNNVCKDDGVESLTHSSHAKADAKLGDSISPGNIGAKDLSIPEEETKELDRRMSEVVLGAEPDISALIEDLENIQLERDTLQDENKDIEQRLENMTEDSERQQQEHLEQQQTLARRLQELEIGIKMKQECISELVRQEQEAAAKARQNETIAQNLANEAAELHKQLEDLKDSQVADRREADGERSKRRILENKQEKIEQELKELQKAAQKADKKRRTDREQDEKRKTGIQEAEKHHSELSALRVEYTKLTNQLTVNESKHHKDLDRLTSQVSQQRKISDQSKQHISTLEAKNAELNARLERSARQLKERNALHGPGSASKFSKIGAPKTPNRGDQEGVAFGRGAAAGSGGRRSNGVSSPGQAESSIYSVASIRSGGSHSHGKSRNYSAASQNQNSMNSYNTGISRLSPDWLVRRIEEMAQARSARQEVRKLEARCKGLEQEMTQMQIDCKHARKAQNKRDAGTGPYLKELAEIDSKLDRARKIANRAVHGSKKAKDASKVVKGLEQQQQDASNRMTRFNHKQLHQGDAESQALHDITEDMETLEAELDLNRVRLEEETRKLVKGGNCDGTVTVNTAEATILAREIEDRSGGGLNSGHLDTMVTVSQALVDMRYKSAGDAAEILELQCRLDEKESEFEELADATHRSRADMLKKLEQQRRESEDKVAFLLQQLRATEARNLETSSVIRQSREISMGSLGLGEKMSHRHNISAPPSSSYVARSSFDSLEDRGREREDPSFLNMQDLELDEDSIASEREEMARQVAEERERREQLERSNGQLVKELRAVRKSQQRESH
jgi:hypothetical protein